WASPSSAPKIGAPAARTAPLEEVAARTTPAIIGIHNRATTRFAVWFMAGPPHPCPDDEQNPCLTRRTDSRIASTTRQRAAGGAFRAIRDSGPRRAGRRSGTG